MEVGVALYHLALDLRRSSSFHANELWEAVDAELWQKTRNPWLILQTLTKSRQQELKKDKTFVSLVQKHLERQKVSLETSNWFEKTHGKSMTIAYFSMEFGLSESLPIYSGGLGLLAGDHLKACSDLGVPLIGIGLLYQQGYFRQDISPDGKQLALYPFNEPSQLPLKRVNLRIPIEFPGRTVFFRVYQAAIGKISLYLLDSNDLLNEPTDRGITSELYGGGNLTRLKQEVALGIGGVRLLHALGITPDIYHLNEGHAAFAILEQTRYLDEPFDTAFQKAKQKTLFTTHTPVEAGFDRFPLEVMKTAFADYAKMLGISIEALLALGQQNKTDSFNMAYLAVRGSQFVNGVSKLHGEVSQKLFKAFDCNVGAITNGVHIPSWESPKSDALWCQCAGEFRWHTPTKNLKNALEEVSDSELWKYRNQARQELVEYTRRRRHRELSRRGIAAEMTFFLDPTVLTIGFARRFATYKRVDLLLKQEERLIPLLKEKKIQLIVAGKAHPADNPGQELIEKWIAFTSRPEIHPHAVFLSDYDILLAERLVQGMDLWVNTPRRPWEASGTSGMKVLVNGGLNCSSLDGWWAEAYSPDRGWAIPGEDDAQDAETLMTLLEKEIIPLFYQRNTEGIPEGWLKKVKKSMAYLTPEYSTHRMVQEYVEKYYLEMTP
ncbi:MAG: alpha-glucan family phosphorylase [Chlamydiia bacterium]|nr:alpha-glucan family phosphorylase [Chlamydiia bacterium]